MTERYKVQGTRYKVQGSKSMKTQEKAGSRRLKVCREKLEIAGCVWELIMVEV
jgi:hypothetical protein